jgi:Uma2 family endonuclease
MKTREEKSIAKEPSFSYGGKYSYADYLSWEMDEMVEIIKGKVFKWTAAPSRIHQLVSGNIFFYLKNFLQEKSCQIYAAPFDVRLPTKSKKNEDIYTVVQPDLCVICDKSKLDEAGCIGAPDLIVEILSPSNNRKELYHKYEVYRESGVKEYWLVHPFEQTLIVYTLKNGEYLPSRLFGAGDVIHSSVLPGFELDLEEFFRDTD